MSGIWKNKRFKLRMESVLAFLLMFHYSLSLCSCLNSEGLALLMFRERVVRDPFGALLNWNYENGDADPCSWFGVECLDGKVIVLNLRDLCLEGKLAPELGKLTYVKSITLRNNSFWGNIPVEIAELKELEVLDLGYNNFSGLIPSDLGNNLSLSILLVDNNEFLSGISPELYELSLLSKSHGTENQLRSSALGISCNSRSSAWDTLQDRNVAERKLLQVSNFPNTPKGENDGQNKKTFEASPFLSPSSPPSSSLPLSPVPKGSPFPSKVSPSPSLSPSPSISLPPESPFASSPESLAPSPSPISPPSPAPSPFLNPPLGSMPPVYHPAPLPSPASVPSRQIVQHKSKSKHSATMMWPVLTGGSLFILLSILGIFLCRSSKVVTVKPWATGLSGQLQKAFVTGVPKLQRPELVTACEDFSNIIGSLSDGTVYKGTLSSGVEIAVTSTAVKYAEDWSKTSEAQFRKKIEVLSKVNHKNFVNLIGFCEEEKPFTRMMVFEYAPNGTLFEHLYIKEAERLDWGTRLRIAMGMAYCLEHMHDLTPPIALNNLHSSSIFLTEDYAAKVSDFSFWNEVTAAKMSSSTTELLETSCTDPESNVYNFGVILFELITGKFPYSVDNGSVVDWASDYLKQLPALKEIVDPTLRFAPEEEFEKLSEVIKGCVNPDPKRRPTMKEVTARLKEITDMGPDGATPKLSPLWWAELEILTAEAS